MFQSEEVTYSQLTLPRGGARGYSPMIKQTPGQGGGQSSGTIYAKIDNSRSLFSGLLSPGSSSSSAARTNACFSGPLAAEEEPDTLTPLVGSKSARSAHVVVYSPEGQGTSLRRLSSSVIVSGAGPSSSRESKV